jgi:hypothetical protein
VGEYATRPPADPDDPFLVGVRSRLAESTDDALLTTVGLQLLRRSIYGDGPYNPPRDLAKALLNRAVLLNPNALEARAELVDLRLVEQRSRTHAKVANVAPVEQYQAVSALSEEDRFDLLGNLAMRNHADSRIAAQYDDMKHVAASARGRARRYAEDLLVLASILRHHPDYGAAIFKANMVLGTLALEDGDRRAAVRYMKAAASAPPSEELVYSASIVSWGLLKDLLVAGERESVVDFLERMARINVVRREHLKEWAAAIQGGQMPAFDRRLYR